MERKQVALITGATGFVGSHLAQRLVERANAVHVIVRPRSNPAMLGAAAGRVQVHVHDGSTAGMIEIVGRVRPDVVYHLASHIVSPHRPADIDRLIESNVLFGTQLVEAMAANEVRCLVNTGTSWQHYENAEYRPVSLYAATKQAFEDLLRFYTDAGRIRAISLHLFDTYGPGDPRPKLLHLLVDAALTGDVLAMSPGEQHVDLVHIDDVVEAFIVAARRLLEGRGEPFELYAVSAGRTISIRELVDVFGQLSGRALRIEWGGRPYRFREVMRPWNRGHVLPGWQPRIGIHEGIRQLLEHR